MKNKVLKWIAIIILALLIGICLLLAYVKFGLPNVGPAPTIDVEKTESRIARGEYLAHHVTVCLHCHAQRNWDLFAAPAKEGTFGLGGEAHDQRLGFPGSYISTNITPYHLKDWTDGEIFRAITTGVNKSGKALFPIMPYPNYGQLDEEDIYSIIAYIRTLDEKESHPAESYSDFPMNFIINLIPQKANLQKAPAASTSAEYGEYLVKAAICYECHTIQSADGKFIGEEYAGGQEFRLEDGSIVRSANLTPHETGLGNWSVDKFVQSFKMYKDSNYVAQHVNKGDFQTVMPWTSYAGMTEDDLTAIYNYLMTLTPSDNVVEKFTPSS